MGMKVLQTIILLVLATKIANEVTKERASGEKKATARELVQPDLSYETPKEAERDLADEASLLEQSPSARESNKTYIESRVLGVCEDMCKEVGAYPKCVQCPDFVTPDSTPGVMTWEELLEGMDNLVEWGQGQARGWTAQASRRVLAEKQCDLATARCLGLAPEEN